MCINISGPLNPLICAGTAIVEEVVALATCQSGPIAALTQAEDCCDVFYALLDIPFYAARLCISLPLMLLSALADTVMEIYTCIMGEELTPEEREIRDLARNYSINRSRIGAPAPPIDVEALCANVDVQVNELTARYFDLFPEAEQDHDRLTGLVRFVENRRGPDEAYNDSMTAHTKQFILLLRNPEIDVEKKRQEFREILQIFGACQPGVHARTVQAVHNLSIDAAASVEELFLRCLHSIREQVIQEAFLFGEPVHVLNQARKYAPDWLNPDKVSQDDEYLLVGGIFTSGLTYRYALNRSLTIARLVAGILNRTRMDRNNPLFIRYFEHGLPPEQLPEDWAFDFFSEVQLSPILRRELPNARAIAWILGRIGLLTPRG
jgi:hypothetical protein